MPLNGDLARRLQLDWHNRPSDSEKGDPTYEVLYEMERWSLVALSGFQDIVATVFNREAEEGRGF